MPEILSLGEKLHSDNGNLSGLSPRRGIRMEILKKTVRGREAGITHHIWWE